jgi:hypothetical protein
MNDNTKSNEIFPATTGEIKEHLTRSRKMNVHASSLDEFSSIFPLTQEAKTFLRQSHLLTNQHLLNEDGELPSTEVFTQSIPDFSYLEGAMFSKLYYVMKEYVSEAVGATVKEKIQVLDSLVEQGKAVRQPDGSRSGKTFLHHRMISNFISAYENDSNFEKVHIVIK